MHKIPNLFKSFIDAVQDTFGAALLGQGFQQIGPTCYGRECRVVYRHEQEIAFAISYEPGGTPGIEVTLAVPPGTSKRNLVLDLATLVKKRCPNRRLPHLPMGPGKAGDLHEFLKHALEILGSEFDDILSYSSAHADRFIKEFRG